MGGGGGGVKLAKTCYAIIVVVCVCICMPSDASQRQTCDIIVEAFLWQVDQDPQFSAFGLLVAVIIEQPQNTLDFLQTCF